jgi:hypothetical protein
MLVLLLGNAQGGIIVKGKSSSGPDGQGHALPERAMWTGAQDVLQACTRLWMCAGAAKRFRLKTRLNNLWFSTAPRHTPPQ